MNTMEVPNQQDPREMLMWNGDVTPNKQEISNFFGQRKLPLGVYIPKGNVRVPSIRSKRIRQLEARGNRLANSTPHLLMVRPVDKITNYDTSLSKKHYSSRLVGIPSAKVHKREKISQDETQNRMYNLKNFPSSERLSMTKKEITRNNAPTLATFENIPPLTIQAENVPRSVDGSLHTSKNIELDPMKKSRTQYCDRITISQNQAPYIPPPTAMSCQEMQVKEYYEQLSRFAAMAWSDCSQATEKLRRLYEETTRLSRAYNALGFIPYPIPNSANIMTPTTAAGCGVPISHDVFNTPQHNFSTNKATIQHPDSNHHALCTCSTCEMTRNSQFKVQQLQQTTFNPQAGNMSTNCKEPLHGTVVNHYGNYGDDHLYRKYVDGQCIRNNSVPQPCKPSTFTPSKNQSTKRRINDTVCTNASKMAKLESSIPQLNSIKSNDKLVDVASRYFQHSGSIFGNLFNAQNPVDLTPTLSAQYASNSDFANGCRRSDTSMTSSLCSFDDQRLPCVSSSPSDQLNAAPMHGFGSHSIFPPNAFGMIRTPVVNFNHLA